MTDLNDVKVKVRSVLLSSKEGVKLADFKREYKCLTGEMMPFKTFGYKTLEDFLAFISDVVIVKHQYGESVLYAVSDTSTAHLERLIQSQKSKVRKTRPNRSSSILQPSRRHPRHPKENFPSAGGGFCLKNTTPFHSKNPLLSYSNQLMSLHSKNSSSFSSKTTSSVPSQSKVKSMVRKKSPSPPCTNLPKHRSSFGKMINEDTAKLTTYFENVRVTVSVPSSDSSWHGQLSSEPQRSVQIDSAKSNLLFHKAMAGISGQEASGLRYGSNFEVPPRFQKHHKPSTKPMGKQKGSAIQMRGRNSQDEFAKVENGELYQQALLNYLIQNSLPVEFQTVPAKLCNRVGYVSSIQVSDQVYGSDNIYATLQEAEQASAKRACADLGIGPDKRGIVLKDFSVSVNVLKDRVREIVIKKPNGLWSNQLANEYRESYGEEPPPDLTLTIKQWPDVVRIEALLNHDREILYPSALNTKNRSSRTAFTGKEVHIDDAKPLPLEKEVSVYVTFIYNCDYFYVQPEWSQIDDISEELNSTCESCHVDVSMLEVGGFCAAMYSEDNSWCRAEILSVDKELDEVEVFYVDYGNVEKVSMKRVSQLTEKAAKFPGQAVSCCLYGLVPPKRQSLSEESKNEFAMLVKQERELKALTVMHGNNNSQVILCDPDSPLAVNEILVTKGLAVNVLSDTGVEPESSPPTTPTTESLRGKFGGGAPLTLPGERFWDVYVSFLQSTTDVIIRLVGENYSDELEKLESEIEKWFSTASEDKPITEGSVCAAAVDGLFHRVKILGHKGKKAECLFLDHGDSDDLRLDLLRVLDPHLNTLPYQAIPCTLAGLEQYSNSITAIEKLFDMALGKTCVAEPATKDNKIYVVLYDTMGNEDVNINEVVANEAAGSDLISSFIPETKKSMPTESLSELSLTSSTTLESVLARSESWSRSSDMLNKTTNVNGHLDTKIDPANTILQLDNFFQEESKDSDLPVTDLAAKHDNYKYSWGKSNSPEPWCGSSNEAVLDSFSAEASANSIIQDSANERDINNSFSVKGHSTLKNPGYCQVPKVKSLWFLYVLSAVDPSDFVCLPHNSLEVIGNLMKELDMQLNVDEQFSEQLKTASLVQDYLYAAFFVGCWHRVLFKKSVSEYEILVYFVDSGEFSIIALQNLRHLPERFWDLPFQAVKCRLSDVQAVGGQMWSEAAKYKFFELAKGKSLVALVRKCPDKNRIVEVSLIDTSGKSDICIHEELLYANLAEKIPK